MSSSLRMLLFLSVLFWAIPSERHGVAQQSASASSSDSSASLYSRETALTQQLETLRANNLMESDESVKQVQSDLLEVTGEQDAAMQQLPANSKGATTSYVSLPVYFVTDRTKDGDTFGDELRKTGVGYGLSRVTLGLSYGVRIDFIPGGRNLPQSSHQTAPNLQGLNDLDSLLAAIEAEKTDHHGHKRKVLLFVHGYNTSFLDAINATGRLATMLQFPVIPVTYSWPSSGSLRGYWHDENTVRASFTHFIAFLRAFSVRSPVDVVLICHSMGAIEVSSALAEIGRSNDPYLPQLKQVIFAAADLSDQEFQTEWESLKTLKGVDYSFYVSDHDLALRLSHIVHWLPRLGDAAPKVFAPQGGTTIDASVIDSTYQALGHSYLLNSLKVGADIGESVDGGETPETRGLVKIGAQTNIYYVFP